MPFFIWYYKVGLPALLGILRNMVRFVFEFLSVRELFWTLFSPWHRDVSHKYWRGFDPVRLIQTGAENLISRVVGAIVRSIVIVFALGVLLAMTLLGVFILFSWVAFPLVFCTLLWAGVVSGDALYLLLESIVVCVFVLAIFAYQEKRREASKDADAFLRERWFVRVLGRVGIDASRRDFRPIGSSAELVALLREKNVAEEDFALALDWERGREEERKNARAFWRMENLRRIRPIAGQWRFGFTPHLDQYGFDMLSSRDMDDVRVCAHPTELESMKMTMMREGQNCVLLVAPSGTGKRSMIRFFAKELRERSTDIFSPGERFMHIDLDLVFSAQGGEDSAQGMVEALFSEAVAAGNVVLVIEDIDRYMGESAQRSGIPDISSLVAKYLPVHDFRLIATVSSQGFHASVERNEGMLKYLEVIEVYPIDETMTLSVLLDTFDAVEEKYILFTIGALRNIIRHSGRFHPAVPLPERALDIANESILFWQKHPESRFITESTINAFVSFKTGVPLGDIAVSEKEKLVRLEQILAGRVIGQPEATKQIAQALKRARAGMGEETRPIGSFLFLGPTGVGKTELAKTLATAYFGKKGSLVRLDMSEYQNPNSVDRLIGSQSQNVPGQLASLVRDTPYGVLLLDELEKADAGVRDLFLQILDEGFFTDAFGQKVMFSSLIIIATSNAGARLIKNRSEQGMDPESIKKELIEYVSEKNIFRTEFLNRFDGVIFFRPISGSDVFSVCSILLAEYAETVRQNRGIRIQFDDAVVAKIVDRGYDPVFGARSLKRFIAETIESKIADIIIEQNPSRGDIVTVKEQDI